MDMHEWVEAGAVFVRTLGEIGMGAAARTRRGAAVVVAVTSAIGLAGCALPAQAPPISRMAFPEAEYLVLSKTGTGTVTGQAFLKTRGGDVKTAAGNRVILNPVTSYSLEWFERSYLPDRRMAEPDPRLDTYLATQIADGSGRFTFKNVRAGEYFVTTGVTWEAGTGYQGAMQIQGGTVSKRIKIAEGEVLDVIVTR